MTRIDNNSGSFKPQSEQQDTQTNKLDKLKGSQGDLISAPVFETGKNKTLPENEKAKTEIEDKRVIFNRKMAEAIKKNVHPDNLKQGESKKNSFVKSDAGKNNIVGETTLTSALQHQTVQPLNSTVPAVSTSHAADTGLALIDSIAQRVEQALHAELSSDWSGKPVTWQFDLVEGEASQSGIHGVEISMTDTTLDIVLMRKDGYQTNAHFAAAQYLAEHLQARFSQRIVRVHELINEAKKSENDGFNTYSDFLNHSGKKL